MRRTSSTTSVTEDDNGRYTLTRKPTGVKEGTLNGPYHFWYVTETSTGDLLHIAESDNTARKWIDIKQYVDFLEDELSASLKLHP